MKYSLLVLTLFVFFLFSCSGDVHDVYTSGRSTSGVARVKDHYFPTIQDAINYVCGTEYTENKGLEDEYEDEDETIYVLVSQCTGSSIVFPSCEKTVVIDFNNCVYTFTDDTKIAVKIEPCTKVTINNATFIINSTNESIEYVYWIDSDYSQDSVRVIDNRGVTQSNCVNFQNSQKIYIAEGKDVSFGNTTFINSVNVAGWLTVNSLSDLSLVSGSYTFWAILGDGTIFIDDGVTIHIFKKDAELILSYIDELSAVNVVVMDDECPHTNYKTVVRPASCIREGRTWKQCTDCGTCLETLETTPKLPHDFSSEWTSDNHEHWHECDNCHTGSDHDEHNQHIRYIDDNYHMFECDVCHYITQKEEHIWGEDDCCEVCGINKPESPAEGGGFNIQILRRNPMGVLTTSEENNVWTVTLKDMNVEYPITGVRWIEDGEEIPDYDNSYEYVLKDLLPRTYFINCAISNQYGSTVLEAVVDGAK